MVDTLVESASNVEASSFYLAVTLLTIKLCGNVIVLYLRQLNCIQLRVSNLVMLKLLRTEDSTLFKYVPEAKNADIKYCLPGTV